MSIFKKPEKGFLAKLFKHKQVEELAEELAHTYADEMQAEMLSDNSETDTAEDTAAEPVPMLEVTESGEMDFTELPETTEGESPPQDSADSTEPSEVRKHLITFRVNDMELEAINRRYAETSFKSRGDFCRYSALTVMNVEEDTEDIKQIARYISSISNSFNQVIPFTAVSGSMNQLTALPSRPLLESHLRRTETPLRAVRACGAENSNRLKRKDLRNACVSKSQVFV